MNHSPSRPRAGFFESFIAFVLFLLALMFIGAATGFIWRLILAGWRAADFLFNLF